MGRASPVVELIRAIIEATERVGIHGISNKSWHGWVGRRQARASALRHGYLVHRDGLLVVTAKGRAAAEVGP